MDKNKIKSFAIWARRNLIGAVSEKAYSIGITEKNIEESIAVQGGFKLKDKEEVFPLSITHRNALIEQVREKGFEQVMEEVAYTWFNRFMGLRYMEVNDYLPTGIRVLSSEIEGKVEPDVLTRVSEVIEELNLNAEEIYELIDSGKTEDREKAYKIILVKQCNEIGNIIPQMFEKISDYTEALLPDNLLEEGSVVRKMVEDIEENDWKEEVEIIGWMYQYYISEKKDNIIDVLKGNNKIKKEELPAATQLFTPKWIVKYMVENSLGKLWIENNPESRIFDDLEFYISAEPNKKNVDKLQPENIRVIDPSMGSGHILLYAFDILYKIYISSGYTEREIPRLILEKNLYGLDIDDRTEQLACFALMMKARKYSRRIFREKINMNLISIQESNSISLEDINYFANKNEHLEKNMKCLLDSFKDAKEYGSILLLERIDLESIKQRIVEIKNEDTLIFDLNSKENILNKFSRIVKQFEIMINKYEVCITNPPYLNNKSMNKNLKEYISKNFNDVKSDLFSVCMKRNFSYTTSNGYLAYMTPLVWMFLKSYEELRDYIINNKHISSLVQLQHDSAFDDVSVGVCTFILKNCYEDIDGEFIRLSDFYGIDLQPKKLKEAINNNVSYRYKSNSKDFKFIPGKTISYWTSETVKEIFKNENPLSNYAEVKKGMDTGNNNVYLRMWHEVSCEKVGIGLPNSERTMIGEKKWIPYNKGGEYRKWYGNNEFIVNWQDDGKELKNSKANLRSKHLYFKDAITWTAVSTGKISFRESKYGALFDSAGSSMFVLQEGHFYYILSLLNTKLINDIIDMINPTLNYGSGTISKIPTIIPNDPNIIDEISNIAKENVDICKREMSNFEQYWDFRIHPLVRLKRELRSNDNFKIEEIFKLWEEERVEEFNKLKRNEIKLNKEFSDIYNIEERLRSEIKDKDISLRKAALERDIKSLISYGIGCMFGRYSLDTEGLIYAGGNFNDKWNLDTRSVRRAENGNIISNMWIESTFIPDIDNIIPITEEEYFEDDIVFKFIEFIRKAYGESTLEENLEYIANGLQKRVNETSRQTIRKYFLNDFYINHLKDYQTKNSGTRPIYWMIDSGKNNGFKALIYMHRYNDQTVAKVRTDYLHILQRKYEAAIKQQESIQDSDSASAKDKITAKKKIDRISKQIEECREYDQVVAHLANEQITIDLDDGVKVNYEKFQGVDIINSKDKKVSMNLLAKI